MAKYKSRGNTTIGGQEVTDGAIVEAHLVSAEEKTLQAAMPGGGIEHLTTGDALVTLADKSQHVVRAQAFTAQFEPAARDAKVKVAAKEPKEGKNT